MEIIKLQEFIKKDNCYVGTVSFDTLSLGDNSVEQYKKVNFVNRKSDEGRSYALESTDSGFQFVIDCNEDLWNAGVWDAYVESTQEEAKQIPLSMDASSYLVNKGIFSIEAIHYVDAKKIYIPLISKDGNLIIKVGGKNNTSFSCGRISVHDYSIAEEYLKLDGIEWPESKCYEACFVVESSDGSIRWQIPICTEATVSIALEDLKKAIYFTEGHKRWNIWIEINSGNLLKRYVLVLQEETKKNATYPLLEPISSQSNVSKLILLHHTSADRELRFAYGEIKELITKYAYGLLTEFEMNKGKIQISGKIFCMGSKLLGLRLINRDAAVEDCYNFDLKNLQEKEGDTFFDSEVDLKELKLKTLYWDFYIVVELFGQEELFRIKNNSNRVFENINKKLIKYSYKVNKEYVAFPYLTNYDNFSIMFREKSEYDSVYYKWKEAFAVWLYKRIAKHFKNQQTWLICEKYAETAQDNSYYFFDYCYKQENQRKVYYIIKKKSTDYKRVKHMKKRVIPFMSLRHMIYMQAPVVMVSSEGRNHFYAWKVGRGRIREAFGKHPYVFLQHGVIGLKKVDYIFKKAVITADLFVTSSDFEKKIIIDHYGYKDTEVIVTGLSRWDVITDKVTTNGPREVILMPTWRTWLGTMRDEEFMETNYYKTYAALIQNEQLENLAKKYNLVINFIIHPKLKQYVTNFSSGSEKVHVYQFDEVPINELLMRASMLITDYSSVAWELYYSKKPVVFFRFDVEQYEQHQGAYMDLKQEIIGEVTDNIPKLLEIVAEYSETDFLEKERFAKERSHYFKYMDRGNAKRIYDAVEKKFGV